MRKPCLSANALDLLEVSLKRWVRSIRRFRVSAGLSRDSWTPINN